MRARSGMVTLGLLVLLSTGASAQAITLRFAPRVGAQIPMLTGARGRIVYRDVGMYGLAGADSIPGEMTSIGGVSERILSARDGQVHIEVRYDSLRNRSRLIGQTWKEEVLGPEPPVLALTVDDRLHVVGSSPGGPAADPVFGVGLAPWCGVTLPSSPVQPGDTWMAGTVFRLPPQLGALFEIAIPDSVVGTAAIALDSLRARSSDTLAFLSVRQSLGPVTVRALDAGDSATLVLSGAQAATLVWSTGWRAFVSGAGEARVRGRLETPTEGGARRADITWTVTTRLQVRL